VFTVRNHFHRHGSALTAATCVILCLALVVGLALPYILRIQQAAADLQTIFGRCYDRADFGSRVDYRNAPAFLHDRIARAAYHLWQQEGCPHGRDKEHWSMAIEQLQRT
jgi:Protein of unknown function (DUF2934)